MANSNAVPHSPTPDEFDLTAILKSGVPGGFWPNQCFLLVVARGKDGKILTKKVYKSSTTALAYKKGIEDLDANMLFGLKELQLMSNFSP